jgi:hypothetical protein
MSPRPIKPLAVIPPPGSRRVGAVRRFLELLFTLVVLLAVYAGVFTLAGSFARYPLASSFPAAVRPQLKGAYHVHSIQSDGRGTHEDIARAAKQAGLSFVLLTDHNISQGSPPRFVEGVLLIPGVELSVPQGHLVAVGMDVPPIWHAWDDDPIGHATKAGAETYLAHPVQTRNPWKDWPRAPNATGFELYSADSMFRRALRHPFSMLLPAAGAYLGNPEHGLMLAVADEVEARQKLLELATKAPKVTMCSLDAHGLPEYRDVFRTLSMVLPRRAEGTQPETLPEDPLEAARQVRADLASGNAYCAFHALADASGFSVQGVREPGRWAPPGEKLRVLLPPSAPPDAQVRVYGAAMLDGDGRTVTVASGGAFLIEVWVNAPGALRGTQPKPWIVTSPVRTSPPPEAPATPVSDAGVAEAGSPTDGGTPPGLAEGADGGLAEQRADGGESVVTSDDAGVTPLVFEGQRR